MSLRTDYKNDELNTAVNTERQFEEVTNPNGTKSYRDVTDYAQIGDNFDANLVNTQNAEINAKAPLESPAFTGTPTAPTQSQSTSDDTIATTAFVKSSYVDFIDPALNTSGKAADAKVTGDMLSAIQALIPQIDDTLSVSGQAADAYATGNRFATVENANIDLRKILEEGVLCDSSLWESGSYNPPTGNPYNSSFQIRTKEAYGVSNGIVRISMDGLHAYIAAWDLLGNYIGFVRGNGDIVASADGMILTNDFDCTRYPQYVFKVVAQFCPTTYAEIDVTSGKNVYFHYADHTLTLPRTADSFSTGYAMDRSMVDHYYLTKDDFIRGMWEYSIPRTYGGERLRSKYRIRVTSGTSILLRNPTYRTYIGVLPGYYAPAYSIAGWRDAGNDVKTINIKVDGYLVVMVDGTSDPNDYDCTIEVRSGVKTGVDRLLPLQILEDGNIKEWSKGSLDVKTGKPYNSSTQIRSDIALGYKTGVSSITSDGVNMYILAWSAETGEYIGFYNSDRVFSKATEKYATWTSFDCSAYPDYVFKIVAQFTQPSSSITVDDGSKVRFHPLLSVTTDKTLTLSDSPADAKVTGERISAVGARTDYLTGSLTWEIGGWYKNESTGKYEKWETNTRCRTTIIPIMNGRITIAKPDTTFGITYYSASKGFLGTQQGSDTLRSLDVVIGDQIFFSAGAASGQQPPTLEQVATVEISVGDNTQNIYSLFGDSKVATWESGSIDVTNGSTYGSDTQIRSAEAFGLSEGVVKIISDSLEMYILAWDKSGNYIGHYNSDGEFSKTASKYRRYSEFDCTLFPDYVFRIVAQNSAGSSSITTDDGKLVSFVTVDETLTMQYKAADAKTVGDAIEAINDSVDLIDEKINLYETATISCWEKGSIVPNTGVNYDSTFQIRTTEAYGYSNGVTRIDSELFMYIIAWDTEGNFIGHYNKSRVFSKDASNYKTYQSFDCTQYPNYVFKIVASYSDSRTTITADDGKLVLFATTDGTLKISNKPADSKTVGHTFDNYNVDYTVSASDLESGSWSYSDKANNNKRLRNAKLYRVNKGMRVRYSNPTLKVYLGLLATEFSLEYIALTGWIPAGNTGAIFNIPSDGYLVLIIEGQTGITPSDYDCNIVIESVLTVVKGTIEPCLYKIFQRVGVIGDSLSVGCTNPIGDNPWVTRALLFSWVKQVGRHAGVPWLNFGTSGQQTLTWCSNSTYGKVQMEAENNKCQAYIIGLGCNDEWQTENHVDLGTVSDIVDDPDVVATTYYGGYNRIIQLLKKRNPKCKIFCLTNPVGVESAGYNDAVRYLATQHYTAEDGVFLVELARGMAKQYTDTATIIGKDRVSVHYSAVGYCAIASVMEEALHNVIRDNQLYFQDVSLIPYDTGTPTPNTMTE